MRAAVCIDDWKLAIFAKHLQKDGFKWKRRKGVTRHTWTLQVECESAAQLAPTVVAANEECRLHFRK